MYVKNKKRKKKTYTLYMYTVYMYYKRNSVKKCQIQYFETLQTLHGEEICIH